MMAVIDLKFDMPLGHAGPLWRPRHEQGRTIFAQLVEHLPIHEFRKCVARYRRQSQGQDLLLLGPVPVHGLCPVDLPREPARHRGLPADAPGRRLYHMGIRGKVSRSTLADANEARDWRIYADFAQVLIAQARALYVRRRSGTGPRRTRSTPWTRRPSTCA